MTANIVPDVLNFESAPLQFEVLSKDRIRMHYFIFISQISENWYTGAYEWVKEAYYYLFDFFVKMPHKFVVGGAVHRLFFITSS